MMLTVFTLILVLFAAAAANVTVVESTPSRLVLSWEMAGFETAALSGGRGQVTRIFYDGGHVPTGDSGAVMIPAYSIHAGVPGQGAVRVTVTPEELSTVRVANPLERRGSAPGPHEHVFRSAWVSEPVYGTLRDYRNAHILLRPVRDLGSGSVQLLKKARVTIDFPAASHTGVTWAPRGDYERMVRSLLLNFNTAQGWQPARGRSLRKAASEIESYPFAPNQRIAAFRVGDGHRGGNEVSLKENTLIRISGKRIRELFGDSVRISNVSLYASPKGEMEVIVPEVGEIPAGVFEVPIIRRDLNRNGFVDDEDYIIAYVSAASDWSIDMARRFNFSLNRYDDYRTYRLVVGNRPGAEMVLYAQPPPEPGMEIRDYFDAHLYFRSPNFLSRDRFANDGGDGGIDWSWRRFSLGNADTTIRLDLPGLVENSGGIAWFHRGAINHSNGSSSISARLGAVEICANCNSGGAFINAWGPGPSRDLNIRFRNTAQDNQGFIELNAVHLQYSRSIAVSENTGLIDVFSADAVDFQTNGSIARHISVPYRLTNTGGSLAYVLRVPLDEREISLIDTTREPSFLWSDFGGHGTRYMVMLENDIVDFSDSLKPGVAIDQFTESAEYQIRNLRGNASNRTDYLIITHDDFLGGAIKLARHKTGMGFRYPRVVLLSDILNQFSGGHVDPAAIRNFLLHVYRNWDGGDVFSYVVLIGSGHYDYKGVTTTQPNFMPVPYITNKINEDFYALFEVGIHPNSQFSGFYFLGRLPAKSSAEALDMVQKIIETEDPRYADFDAWRSRLLMSYDDDQQQDRQDYIRDHLLISEALSRTIDRMRPDLDQRKLPLLEFEWDDRWHKPGATRTLINEINNGLALFNWVGHGGASIVADERLFHIQDVSSLTNRRRYPVFSLFTCSVSQFDMPGEDCLASALMRQPGAGAVAVVSSARKALASDNAVLAPQFFTALFDTTAVGADMSISGALTIAKHRVGPGRPGNTFYLTLGDPSLILFRRNRTVDLKITDAQGGALDTLKAMQQITISGTIKDRGLGYDDLSFGSGGDSAFVNITLFNPQQDSVRRKDGGKFFYAHPDSVYTLPGSPVFSARIPVRDGKFEQPLRLPMNLVFGKPGVRLTAHAWKRGDTLIGSGHLGGLIFEGSVNVNVSDTAGPRISVRPIYGDTLMDRTGLLVRNRITAQLPLTLEVSIEDESGINLIGGGPDEGLTMEVRGALSKRPINHLFQFSEGSFNRGTATIIFEKNSLKSGTHELILSAQDLLGNVSKLSVALEIVDPSEIKLDHVINVPNPVRMGRPTRFYYHHSNTPGDLDVRVTIRIYTLGGRLISVIRNPRNGEEWIPRDQAGNMLTPNVYLYQVTATSQNINRTVKSKVKKLVVHPPR
jgi:hypothetical protein